MEYLLPYEGLFSSESMNVRLGFSWAAHDVARAAFSQSGRVSEEMKTYVHELTHYVQATTTPYGLFLHYCRQLQTADTIELIRALLGNGLRIQRPLLFRAPIDISGPVSSTVRGLVTRWVYTEWFAAFLGQNPAKIARYTEILTAAESTLPFIPLIETFGRLQGAMAHFVWTENSGRTAYGMLQWDNGEFDVDAINAEGDGTRVQRSRDLEGYLALTELIISNPWGTESILESAAVAAEWAESGRSLDELRVFAADDRDPDTAMYRRCLERGLEAIPADDLPQFCFSFITLCELALQAPLLPQHAGLRKGRLDPMQLFPSLRFLALLAPAKKVLPLQGLADVGRYSLELCHALDWVHPIQIQAVAVNGPVVVADRRAQRYIWAQQERARCQHAFTNLLRRDGNPGATGYEFRQRYAFPVIEYADRTLYMSDKDTLWWLTTQHLLTRTMRQVMLGNTLKIPCPYQGAPDELKTLTIWLRAELELLFERPFPMAEVISLAAAGSGS